MKILSGGHGAVASQHRMGKVSQPSIVNRVGEDQPSLWGMSHKEGTSSMEEIMRERHSTKWAGQECEHFGCGHFGCQGRTRKYIFSFCLEVESLPWGGGGLYMQIVISRNSGMAYLDRE